jgi:hypothetical protein
VCFFFTDKSYGRGGGVGRPLGVPCGLGVGVGLGVVVGVGVGVNVAVAVAVAVGVGVAVEVGVAVAVAVAVGVGEGVPQPAVPFTPMEKSGWPISPDEVLWKTKPNVVLLMNALSSFPQGKPTQLVPLVSELNERPVPLPIGVTLSQ